MPTIITVELSIPGDYKHEPIFYHMIKKFHVTPNIIEASFSTETGWAIVTLKGKKEEVEKMLRFLQKKGVEVTLRN